MGLEMEYTKSVELVDSILQEATMLKLVKN